MSIYDRAEIIGPAASGLSPELYRRWGRTLGLQVAPEEVDAIYQRLEAAGATLKARPRVRAWGMRGFGALDPTGVPVNVYASSVTTS